MQTLNLAEKSKKVDYCHFCEAARKQSGKPHLVIPKAEYILTTHFGEWARACRIHFQIYGGHGERIIHNI
jgi:hypothetical protein